MKRKQRGAALVVSMVLMVAMMAMGVAGSSLALHTERQAGNAVQQSIAFSAAEAGAIEAIAALRQLAADDVDIPVAGSWAGTDVHELGGIFAGTGHEPAAMVDHDGLSGFWIQSVTFFADRIALQARGAMYDGLGTRAVNVILSRDGSLINGPSGPPMRGPGANAIVACEGVDLQGSGAIRATHSLDQNYNGTDADVFTIGENANINISGGTRIEGSVSATGGVSAAGSSVVEGGAVANTDIVLSGGGSAILGSAQTRGNLTVNNGSSETRVGGSAVVGGNINLTNGQIRGDAFAGGNLRLSNSSARVTGNATVNGDVNLFDSGGGIVDGLLTYGGDIVGMQNWQSLDNYAIGGNVQTNPAIQAPPEVATQDCDPFGIAEINEAERQKTGLDEMGAYTPSGRWNGARHNMADLMTNTGTQGERSLDINGDWRIASQMVDFPAGGKVTVKVDGNFTLTSGGNLTIPPNTDVVMVVNGNFDINGGTNLNIGSGSTLTVHLGGRMNVTGGGFIVQDGAPVTTNQSGDLAARVNIFSDFDNASNAGPSNHNDSGIKIGGNSNYHANIYAPKTDVSIMEGGTLNGAVWGQRVKVPGGAKINYDVALREAANPFQVVPTIIEEVAGPVVLNLIGWQEM